ncbi:MAG TPA: HEAT repeat domain-containing protein [Chitinophagaceae bacterium]
MEETIAKEIEDLKSTNNDVRDKAFEAIIRRKSTAVPSLLEVLSNDMQPQRVLAAAALATIADKTSADIVSKYIDDGNEKVRAWSAIALRRMNDIRALPSLFKTINDYPDEAHTDQTLSTYALIQWGEEILLPLIPLLNAPERETRQHAFSVLKKVVYNKLKTKEAWENAWVTNGSYNADSMEQLRLSGIEKWEKWIYKNIL